jgi:hypothetical protein
VQAAAIGQSHAAFLRGIQGSTSIKVELEQWLEHVYALVCSHTCPWQTLVLGGFSDIASMVLEEAERDVAKTSRKDDPQRVWGLVLTWYQKTMHMLFSLPLHIIVELGVKATMDKDNRDQVARVEPDLSGRGGRLVLPRELDMLLYTERDMNVFSTYFVPRVSKPVFYAKNRFVSLCFPQPVQDCSYDVFAQALGLQPIWVCDPGHPRCQPGRWPWPTPWHV